MASKSKPTPGNSSEEYNDLLDGLSTLFAPRQLFHTVKFEGDLAEEVTHHLGLASAELKFPTLARDEPVRDGVSEQRELDMMWMTGFVDHEADVIAASRPDIASLLNKEKRAPKYLSGQEIARMREMDAETAAEKTLGGGPASMKDRLADSEYLKENDRIRRSLVARRRGRGGLGLALSSKLTAKPVPQMRSSAMDRLMLLERMEMEAAAAIQRRWRKHRRIVYWKRWLLEKRCQEVIARAWRAFAARMRARVWRAMLFKRVVLFQARYRGMLARQRVREDRLFLNDAATDIQRGARGWLTRVRLRRRRANAAATRIAAFWRRCKGRAVADRLFLDRTATAIQSSVRRWLVQASYRRRSSKEVTAATRIQQMFRKWKALAVRDGALWARETAARRGWMEVLSAEQAHCEGSLAGLTQPHVVAAEAAGLGRLDAEWGQACDFIAHKEFDLVSLQNERVKLSPRAIEHGWSGQLDADVAQNRAWVTEGKERALFEVAAPLRAAKAARLARLEHCADLTEHGETLRARWVAERTALWDRDNERAWSHEGDERQKRVADERRRWAVSHFTETGKPDVARNLQAESRRLQALGVIGRDGGLAGSGMLQLTRAGALLLLGSGAQPTRVTLGDSDLLALTQPEPPRTGEEVRADQREARLRLENRLRLHMADYDRRFGNLFGGDGWGEGAAGGGPPPGLMPGGAPVRALADGTLGKTGALAVASPTESRALQDGAVTAASLVGGQTLSNSAPRPPALQTTTLSDPSAPAPAASTSATSLPRSTFGPLGSSMTVGGFFNGQFAREPEDERALAEARTEARLRQLAYGGIYRSLGDVVESGRVRRFDPTALAARHGEIAAAQAGAAGGSSGAEPSPLPDVDEAQLALVRKVPDYLLQRHDPAGGSYQNQNQQQLVGFPGAAGVAAASAAVDAISARVRARDQLVAGAAALADPSRRGWVTSVEERSQSHSDEIASYDILGARISHLSAKVAAVSGQAEVQQYGSLLRPLMDGMSRLMANMVAADGTDKEVAAVEARAEEMTAARKAHLQELKSQRAEREAPGGAGAATAGGAGCGRRASAQPSSCPGAPASTGLNQRPPASRQGATGRAAAPERGGATTTTGGRGGAPPQPANSARTGAVSRGSGSSGASRESGRPGTATAAAAGGRTAGGLKRAPTTGGVGDRAGTAGDGAGGTGKAAGVGFRVPGSGANVPGSGASDLEASAGKLRAAHEKLRASAQRHDAALQRKAARSASIGAMPAGTPVTDVTGGGAEPAEGRDVQQAVGQPDAAGAPRRWTLNDELAHQRQKLAQEKRTLQARKAPGTGNGTA